MGWPDFRADRRVVGLLGKHGSPVLRPWAYRDPGTIGGHMPQIPPDRELKAIESALGELIPVSSRLDRDKLMFQAGAMSKPAPSRRWAWPAITAVLSVALAGESLFSWRARPAPQDVEQIVFFAACPRRRLPHQFATRPSRKKRPPPRIARLAVAGSPTTAWCRQDRFPPTRRQALPTISGFRTW